MVGVPPMSPWASLTSILPRFVGVPPVKGELALAIVKSSALSLGAKAVSLFSCVKVVSPDVVEGKVAKSVINPVSKTFWLSRYNRESSLKAREGGMNEYPLSGDKYPLLYFQSYLARKLGSALIIGIRSLSSRLNLVGIWAIHILFLSYPGEFSETQVGIRNRQ